MPISRLCGFFLALLTAALTACGGAANPETESPMLNSFSGLLSDGPITGAVITVQDANRQTLATVVSDQSAHFEAKLAGDVQFPLYFVASGGLDSVTGLVPDFTLQAVVLNQSQNTVNVNLYSSLMVQIASQMQGGLNADNLATANTLLLQSFNFGIDESAVADPMHSDINTATISRSVLANDALAETMRRSRDALADAGISVSTDALLEIIGGDMSDGLFDGRGPLGDDRISVTVLVTAAQILVEIIDGNFTINSQTAMSLLDNGIRVAEPQASLSIQSLPILGEQLMLATSGVSAAQRLTPSPALQTLVSQLQGVTNGVRTDTISIDSTAISELNTTINALSQASDQSFQAITDAIRAGTLTHGGGSGGSGSSSGNNVDLLQVNHASTASLWSVQNNLGSGDTMYADRNYLFKNIPAQLSGVTWIQTANDSRAYTADDLAADDLATVQINFNADLIIAHRDDIAVKPAWMAEYTDSGLDLTNNEPHTYSLYYRTVSSGTSVILGANGDTGKGMYTIIVGPAGILTGGSGGSGGGGVATPMTVNDSTSTGENTAVNINILDNDTGLDDTPLQLSIATAATHGSTVVQSNMTVTYTPNSNFSGSDSFVYRIVDADGDIALGTVTITVVCSSCASGVDLNVTWDPNADSVSGYRVYGGPDAASATTLLRDITLGSLVNPSLPATVFSATSDLSLSWGENYCFVVRAYNAIGVSAQSTAKCISMPLN